MSQEGRAIPHKKDTIVVFFFRFGFIWEFMTSFMNASEDKKCVDPCHGVCGINAICNIQNNSAHCSCIPGYHGKDPYLGCREWVGPRAGKGPYTNYVDK